MNDRRTYLKRTGLVLLGLAASPMVSAALQGKAGRKFKPAMIIDVNRCMGCHSCVISCKVQNGTPQGFFNTRIEKKAHGRFPAAWQAYTPELCHQCDEAPCVAACGNDATFQLENGIVVVDWDRCKGSGDCIPACPYGARFQDQEQGNKADKCDFCITRLERGLEPACVESCPAGARIFGDLAKPQGEFAQYLAGFKAEKTGGSGNNGEKLFYTTAQKG